MKATTKQARKPGKAWCGAEQSVKFAVTCFANYVSAVDSLDLAQELFRTAREGMRIELARAWRYITTPKARDNYKAQLRTGLVAAKVCVDAKAAGRLINNALIALGLTGQGVRKGGKRKGAGRPETTETGAAEKLSDKDVAARLVRALAYIAKAQEDNAGDSEMLETLGAIAGILGGDKAPTDRELIARAIRA